MKHFFKKISYTILLITISLSIFSGCSNQNSQNNLNTSPISTSQTQQNSSLNSNNRLIIKSHIDFSSESLDVFSNSFSLKIPKYKDSKVFNKIKTGPSDSEYSGILFAANELSKDKMIFGIAEYSGENKNPISEYSSETTEATLASRYFKFCFQNMFSNIVGINEFEISATKCNLVEDSVGYNTYSVILRYDCKKFGGEYVYVKGFCEFISNKPVLYFACDLSPDYSYDTSVINEINQMKDSFAEI